MSTTIPARVNPPLLEWARKEAGFTREEVAQRIKRPVDTLRAWEEGEAQPTLRQAEGLAKLYDRSFSIFSPAVSAGASPFSVRVSQATGGSSRSERPELRAAIRRLVQRRRIAIHLCAELGDEPPEFRLRAHLQDDPEAIGHATREALRVPMATQQGWASEFVAYRAWREAVERLGAGLSVSRKGYWRGPRHFDSAFSFASCGN